MSYHNNFNSKVEHVGQNRIDRLNGAYNLQGDNYNMKDNHNPFINNGSINNQERGISDNNTNNFIDMNKKHNNDEEIEGMVSKDPTRPKLKVNDMGIDNINNNINNNNNNFNRSNCGNSKQDEYEHDDHAEGQVEGKFEESLMKQITQNSNNHPQFESTQNESDDDEEEDEDIDAGLRKRLKELVNKGLVREEYVKEYITEDGGKTNDKDRHRKDRRHRTHRRHGTQSKTNLSEDSDGEESDDKKNKRHRGDKESVGQVSYSNKRDTKYTTSKRKRNKVSRHHSLNGKSSNGKSSHHKDVKDLAKYSGGSGHDSDHDSGYDSGRRSSSRPHQGDKSNSNQRSRSNSKSSSTHKSPRSADSSKDCHDKSISPRDGRSHGSHGSHDSKYDIMGGSSKCDKNKSKSKSIGGTYYGSRAWKRRQRILGIYDTSDDKGSNPQGRPKREKIHIGSIKKEKSKKIEFTFGPRINELPGYETMEQQLKSLENTSNNEDSTQNVCNDDWKWDKTDEWSLIRYSPVDNIDGFRIPKNLVSKQEKIDFYSIEKKSPVVPNLAAPFGLMKGISTGPPPPELYTVIPSEFMCNKKNNNGNGNDNNKNVFDTSNYIYDPNCYIHWINGKVNPMAKSPNGSLIVHKTPPAPIQRCDDLSPASREVVVYQGDDENKRRRGYRG